ncbi:MAG: AAA family ATPase, partial [Bacilli bacterium]
YVGFSDGGQLTEKVRRKPYSVILFDEIEKAHEDIFNILLQILEDGRLTDSKGRAVDFRNTIIIMTSNIGFSKEKLGFTNELTIHSKLKEFFSIEFLNRIDKTFTFNKLDSVSINKIIDLKISEITNRLKLNNVKVNYKDFNKKEILNKCNYEEFGARRIEKLIEEQ